MIKLGVTSVEQLRDGKDLTFLGRKKTVSVALYEQILALHDSERLAERVLLQFADDRGAYKRTYSSRFDAFDAKALEFILAVGAPTRSLVVHDVAVSDGRTAVDFFGRVASRFPDLAYYASDYDPEVFVVEKGRTRLVVNRNGRVLEIARSPFVFNLMSRENMLAYPLNYLVRFVLKKMIGGNLQVSMDGARKIVLFCPQAIKLTQTDQRFRLGRYNVLEAPGSPKQADVIRAMNVLNPSYFSDSEMHRAIANLWRGLRGGGLLITGSNQDAGTEVSGGIFAKRDSGFIKLWGSSRGSPVEQQLLTCRPS